MKYVFLALAITCIFSINEASAKKAISSTEGACALKEKVTVTANFNLKANSILEAKKIFDDQVTKITKFAKSGVKLELQSQNYNISSSPKEYGQDGQPISYTYQVNGGNSYEMDSSEQAFKFAEFLIGQKMQIRLDSNAYRQGNCP